MFAERKDSVGTWGILGLALEKKTKNSGEKIITGVICHMIYLIKLLFPRLNVSLNSQKGYNLQVSYRTASSFKELTFLTSFNMATV